MLSSHSQFSYKLLLHSDFQGSFAFWWNQTGSIDSFITVTYTSQNINSVPRMFQELLLHTGEVQVRGEWELLVLSFRVVAGHWTSVQDVSTPEDI